jgi:hypothetical protein
MSSGYLMQGSILLFEAKKNSPHELHIGEMIDNACDAGATDVKITVQNAGKDKGPGIYMLAIKDNGGGIKDFSAVFKPGLHIQSGAGRTTGMHGHGGTYAHAWLCYDRRLSSSQVAVRSTVEGFRYSARYPIGEIMANPDKPIPTVGHDDDSSIRVLVEDAPGEPNGTTVTLYGGARIGELFNDRILLDELRRKIGRMYMKPILDGCLKITINGVEVSPSPISWVGTPIEVDGFVQQGDLFFNFHLVLGEVPRGDFAKTIEVVHAKRHLNFDGSAETFRLPIPPGCFGIMTLGEVTDIDGVESPETHWPLNANKDGIDSSFRSAIINTLKGNQAIADMIEAIARKNEAAKDKELLDALNDHIDGCEESLGGSEPGRRERRDRPEVPNPGTVVPPPVPTGVVRNFRKDQAGSKPAIARDKPPRIETVKNGEKRPPLDCQELPDGSWVIEINTDHPGVSEWMKTRDQISLPVPKEKFTRTVQATCIAWFYALNKFPAADLKAARAHYLNHFSRLIGRMGSED